MKIAPSGLTRSTGISAIVAGWGDDLDALAGRRSRRTAVVVLEPLQVSAAA